MNGVVAAAGASSRSLDVRVACDEDGGAWPTRRAIMGTGFEPTSSFFVIDCLAPWSFQSAPPCPFSSHRRRVLLLALAVISVIVPRFVSPFRPSIFPPGLRPVVLLRASSPVALWLAKRWQNHISATGFPAVVLGPSRLASPVSNLGAAR